jgi:hypothetical protein
MYSELTYIHRSAQMRTQAKKHLGYIETRHGKDYEIMERPLFGKGGRYSPEQATKIIDNAPGNTLFWKMILNPDPVLENPEKLLDLRQLTNDAVRWLEFRIGIEGQARNLPYIGAIHDDHTQLAHIHAVVLMSRLGRERPITPQILREFNLTVSALALDQVRDRTQALSAAKPIITEADLQQEQVVEEAGSGVSDTVGGSYEPSGSGGAAIDGWGSPSCPSCSVGTLNRRLNSKVYECDVCGYAQRYGQMIRSGRRKEAERVRSL